LDVHEETIVMTAVRILNPDSTPRGRPLTLQGTTHCAFTDMQLGSNVFLVAALGMKMLYRNPVLSVDHGSTLLALTP
jgi:hypothetical protein